MSLAITGCTFSAKNNDRSIYSSDTTSEPATIPVTSITLDNASLEIVEGGKGQISIKSVLPTSATDQSVSYSSNDKNVVVVSSSGLVTAVQTGSTKVVVSANDGSGVKTECSVTVIEKRVDDGIAKQNARLTYSDLDPSYNLPSKGKQTVLVLPIYFSDDRANATAENREIIRKGFFGTAEDCKWNSFNSYYKTASFDQLDYEGYVADWYAYPKTKQYILDTSQSYVQTVVRDTLANFKQTNPSFDWSNYDNNHDGFVDQICVVYASDYVTNNGKTTNLWGFRWQTTQTDTLGGLQPYAFTWFSLKFLKNLNNYGGVPQGGINTRIITHEHGHMLGLYDYYDTTYAGGVDYVGGYDMQSKNMMDWNSFSKYAVGWVSPYVIDYDTMLTKKTATVTIGSAALDGDCILVKGSDWKGHPFDEYIMIELLNPYAGNNAYDCKNGAKDIGTGGIRLYHVDARVISYGEELGHYSTFDSNRRYNHRFNNDYSDGEHLLHLIQAGGSNTFGTKTGDGGSRDTLMKRDLFQTGDTFCLGTHDGFRNYGTNFFMNGTTFNNGSTLPYGIKFDKVTPNSATITFTLFE